MTVFSWTFRPKICLQIPGASDSVTPKIIRLPGKNKTMVPMSLLLKLEPICAKSFLKMNFNRLKSRQMAKFMISFVPVFAEFVR